MQIQRVNWFVLKHHETVDRVVYSCKVKVSDKVGWILLHVTKVVSFLCNQETKWHTTYIN